MDVLEGKVLAEANKAAGEEVQRQAEALQEASLKANELATGPSSAAAVDARRDNDSIGSPPSSIQRGGECSGAVADDP